MTIDISCITKEEFDTWDRCVDRSPEATVFHRSAILVQLANHVSGTLHPLIGYKGQEPVGILPLFELVKGPVCAVFSPPPTTWVEYLGPARLNMSKLSCRKAEYRHQRFIDACFEYVDEVIDPVVTRIESPPRYKDTRPFQWAGYTMIPEYTYVVELTDEDDMLSRFSSDARGNIRDSYDTDFTISREDESALHLILDQVERRYREQSAPVTLPSSFLGDLYESLSDDELRPYVCRVDGEFVGGIIVVADDDTAYRWIGGVRPERAIDFPVNDLLDWTVMTDMMADDREYYDLVGAGAERINEYKAKFDPTLETFYRIQSNPLVFYALSSAYEKVERYRLALRGDINNSSDSVQQFRNAVTNMFGGN